MLTCRVCGMTSIGSAWHWIAHLVPGHHGAAVAAYCPQCAESNFKFFSRRIRRPAFTGDE